jgi:hypothetical protein
MKHSIQYSTGLLALTSVLINSGGEISERELEYTQKLRDSEGIPKPLFDAVKDSILGKAGRDVYQIGIDSINQCTDAEKLRAFVKMCQLAMADGVIQAKEVRLLLYAVKIKNADINTVMKMAEATIAII